MRLCVYFLLIVCSYQAYATDENLLGWHRYTSENFVLYTDLELKQAAEIVQEVETFRFVILQFMKGTERKKAQPLEMVLFTNRQLWEHTGKDANIGGYFVHPTAGPKAAIAPTDDISKSLSTVFHEYIHHLVTAYVPFRFPEWYNEGVAEFFATLAIEDDYVYIGSIPSFRVAGLERFGLMKVEDIFEVERLWDEPSRVKNRFYPSTWLLTHYITLGARNGFPSHYQSSMNFIEKQRSGMSLEEAFDASFDISMSELTKELRRYARSTSKKGFAIERPKLNLSIDREALSPAQVQARLSLYYGVTNNSEIGIAFMQQAADQQDPLGLSLLAMHYAKQGKLDEASQALSQITLSENLSTEVLYQISSAANVLMLAYAEQENLAKTLSALDMSKETLEKSLNKGPYLPSLIRHMQISIAANDKEAITATIQELEKFYGYHIMANILIADAYSYLGEPTSEAVYLRRALDRISHTSTENGLYTSLENRLSGLNDGG
jgi:hypothetical protein